MPLVMIMCEKKIGNCTCDKMINVLNSEMNQDIFVYFSSRPVVRNWFYILFSITVIYFWVTWFECFYLTAITSQGSNYLLN